MSGWNLYARVAPFADCRKFTPPDGTAILCEATPAIEPARAIWLRLGSGIGSQKTFRAWTKTGRKLGEFAKRAIIHQPWDYVRAVSDRSREVYRSSNCSAPRLRRHTARDFIVRMARYGSRRSVVRAMSQFIQRDATFVCTGNTLLAFYQNPFASEWLDLWRRFLFSPSTGLVKARGAIRLGIIVVRPERLWPLRDPGNDAFVRLSIRYSSGDIHGRIRCARCRFSGAASYGWDEPARQVATGEALFT